MDGLNPHRQARIADILADFRTLQDSIIAVPIHPPHPDDYWTEGWAALRQCNFDGRQILNCGADTSVPQGQGPMEQDKAELQQIHLDVYARRHECQKISFRQAAACRWVANRKTVLQGQRPTPAHAAQLQACDQKLRLEFATITNEVIYNELQASDLATRRWTGEDPSLQQVVHWLSTRKPA